MIKDGAPHSVFFSEHSAREYVVQESGIETSPRGSRACWVIQPLDLISPGLSDIDKVKVLTDLCTDDLQEELDAGWRVVAVCPQRNQRRPDYILGRQKIKDNADDR